MGPKIPREDLVDDLISADEKVNGSLSKVEYDSVGKHDSTTITREFGSWNIAKDDVGIEKDTSGDTTTIRSTDYRLRRLRQVKETVGCYFCDYDENYVAIDFHHVDGDEKSGSVTHLLYSGWYDWLEEARKCIIICSNCHRMLTHGKITY